MHAVLCIQTLYVHGPVVYLDTLHHVDSKTSPTNLHMEKTPENNGQTGGKRTDHGILG